MTTIVRRRRSSRVGLSVYKRHELLTGQIVPVVSGYNGYATGNGRNLADYISDEIRRDWQNHRAALMEFWTSGKSDAEVFPDDTLPWLCVGDRSRLPWAARHFGLGAQNTGNIGKYGH